MRKKKWKALKSVETVEITPALRKPLQAYKERTGKGPQAVLRGTQASRPLAVLARVPRRGAPLPAGGPAEALSATLKP
jgi:hypothetical protein